MHDYKNRRPTMPPANSRPPEWVSALLIVGLSFVMFLAVFMAGAQ